MKGVVRPLGWAAPQPRRAVLARSSLPARVSPTTLREVVSDISITLYGEKRRRRSFAIGELLAPRNRILDGGWICGGIDAWSSVCRRSFDAVGVGSRKLL